MKIEYGKGTTEYGPGVDIFLTGCDVAMAISAYLVAHDIHVVGPRTITVNKELCDCGKVYVDPSGFVIHNGNTPVISIEDNGIGIPQDKLPYIFNEYFRTEEAAQHNKNSTGLGLAIVKHVAKTHNIDVAVETMLHHGTKFILSFKNI